MFNLKQTLTDELTHIRERARLYKNYTLSDEIRNELDARGSFCFDNPNGQEVYHLGLGYTREWVIKNRQFLDMQFKANV
jgi:hypothetical protein